MLSTVLVGMVGIYLLSDLGLLAVKPKAAVLGANIIGGLIFGVGWGLVGYCPGTSLGALGEGRWDAIWAILGMIFGAGLFAEVYPGLKRTVMVWGDLGKITLTQVLGINHWLVIGAMFVLVLPLFWWFERKGL
jgi:hypothetical protein